VCRSVVIQAHLPFLMFCGNIYYNHRPYMKYYDVYDVSSINEVLGVEGPDLIEDTISEEEINYLDYLDPEKVRQNRNEYMREYNKKYYHENPERAKEWRDKRIERRRETERAWRAKNRERLNARKREQYLKKKLENVDKE